MQTFLPSPDFDISAQVLDSKRLIAQRKEAYQILLTIANNKKGYANHPATNMWRGYLPALADYILAMDREYVKRRISGKFHSINEYSPGIKIDAERFVKDEYEMPWWHGVALFHRAHQLNLLGKLNNHYSQFFEPRRKSEKVWNIWPESKPCELIIINRPFCDISRGKGIWTRFLIKYENDKLILGEEALSYTMLNKDNVNIHTNYGVVKNG